jgi:integrase
MGKNRHLQRRGDVWHYSRTVPPDVRDVIGVGRYWRRSLRTSIKSEAVVARDELDVKFNREIETARNLTGAGRATRIKANIDRRGFVNKLTPDALASSLELLVHGTPSLDEGVALAEARERTVIEATRLLPSLEVEDKDEVARAGGVPEFIREASTRRFLAISGFYGVLPSESEKDEPFADTDRIVVLGEQHQLRRDKEILRKLGLSDPAEDEVPESDENPRLLAALESWLKKRHMNPSTKNKYRMHIARLANFLGNLTLKSYTPQMIEIFVTAYGEMPNTRRLSPRERGLPMRELLAKRKLNPDLPPYGAVNVIKMCDYLKSFLRAMKRKDLADAIEKPEDDRPLSKQREGYPPISPAHMRLLLPAVDNRWGPKSDTAWWIWLLAYSGMRPEEAAQLARTNIVKQGDLWCVEVDDEEERRVKNVSSLRTVPIHPKLIKRGFIEFAKPGQPGNVFASFKDDKGDLSDNPSRRLKTLLLKLNIAGYGSAHRFRASYIDAMRNARVSYAVELRLVGHVDKNRVHGGYGLGADVRTAARELHKIDPCRDP